VLYLTIKLKLPWVEGVEWGRSGIKSGGRRGGDPFNGMLYLELFRL